MNLVWYLTIGTIISFLLGEFGRFPFGGGAISVTLYDALLAISLVCLAIWKIDIKKDLRSFKIIYIFIPFWVVAIISLIFSKHLSGIIYLARFTVYCLSLVIGYSLVQDKITTPKKLMDYIIALGVGLSLIGFLQLIFFPDIRPLASFGFDPHSGRLVSTFLDPNFLGSFLCVILNLCVLQFSILKQRRYLIWSGIICLAIFLTFSRSAYLFLGLDILLWGIFLYRRILTISIIAVLLLLLLVPRFSQRIAGGISIDRSSSERFLSWQIGSKIFVEQPILGIGFNNLRDYVTTHDLIKTYSENGGHAGAGIDSSLLFILATTGLLGLVSYLFIWFRLLVLVRSSRLFFLSVFLGLLINSQFINSLVYPPIMFLSLVWLGGLIGQPKTNQS